MAINQQQTSLGLEDTGTAKAADAEHERVRAEYRARLAEKLKDPAFRQIEGFPIGTDEAILALSDPPHYTACPNPFIEEWLTENGKPYDRAEDNYHREPFAADVSEGKNDPIYNAHSYHTKVPHKAIMHYILHYTDPGDVVYDAFCGTGMTGVAAYMCGDRAQLASLGYRVSPDGTISDGSGRAFSRIGARQAILNDLSPAATFIACNYNSPMNAHALQATVQGVLQELESEYGWMYRTVHDFTDEEVEDLAGAIRTTASMDDLRSLVSALNNNPSIISGRQSDVRVGRILYIVWSEVFICPACSDEIVFWEAAADYENTRIRETFKCPACLVETSKRRAARAEQRCFDQVLGTVVAQPKRVPVLVTYLLGRKRVQRPANAFDRALAEKIAELPIADWFPSVELPYMHMTHERTRLDAAGVTHVHHFYTPRNLAIIAALWSRLPARARWCATSFLSRNALRCNRFILNRHNPRGRINGPLTGTYYVPSEQVEQNVIDLAGEKLVNTDWSTHGNLISTCGAQAQVLPPQSVDYIFVDPPFGENIYYSDLNYLTESWHGVFTNAAPEAIVDRAKGKTLVVYQRLMSQCFLDCFRVLRPGRWLTVEFHNSSNAVWNAVQEALQKSGFVVADVRVLNKQHGGIKAAYMVNTVDQDLVISCYRPRDRLEERFKLLQGRPEGAIEFLSEHLRMLPVAPVTEAGRLEPVAERTRTLLFDRMVAYHLQHGARIPVSAAEFYKLLEEQFLERDEMYFLPEQAARYDALKARGVESEQFSLFMRDEKSAVQWVRTQLNERPQTLGDLTPAFMQELREWPEHEPRPELRDLLREYFIEDRGVWRVPDPDNERDLEALRRAALLKLFREYTAAKGPLKTFRTEAVLEGFRYCWETKQYGIVVQVCEKIPAKVLQEIHDLVQFYDIAKDLAPERVEQLEFTWE
jgi:DNA modification methylase